MANLKRNMIELVKEVKEGEVVTETYLTPVFIPLSTVYQALDLTNEMGKVKLENEREMIEKLADFVTKDVYNNQFTKEQLMNGLHAPEAIDILKEQVIFVLRGYQSDKTKKFLEKKN